ncbi:DNA cross-link repair 1C protein [Exophiala viscosa]|uniref:DNA cross-link repair 1C protein n=1 Tax=Exophiala viscosa TaxID=2486360 RepID=UPI0021A04359|nr:DNA cross-link repair 1C protein [Exophiala viscosa]
MSTFNGIVREFPEIRIDYFRSHPNRPPPKAYFLSHMHSDHIVGLEFVKGTFVYCTTTTRNILLKLEKYPHRINFVKGILESRKLHYHHLDTILRPLPLQTATEIELSPKSTIRVTLLDANHCPGAVMFLIEGNGKAVVYTGDIRSEPWWVTSIVQNPVLLPYACGLKTLDCIYLDTTFASREEPYRDFPTKAEGIKELLDKVDQCPPDTTFYFRAWTLGYENVWTALSNFLQSRIHVNEYQLRILGPDKKHGPTGYTEEAALTGYKVGHSQMPGCLTKDNSSRIHSCEPGLQCHQQLSKQQNVVWITPIITRLKDGTEVLEIGAGGGGGDLYQEADLKMEDTATLQQLGEFCAQYTDDEKVRSDIQDVVEYASRFGNFSVTLEGTEIPDASLDAKISLKDFVALLSKRWDASKHHMNHGPLGKLAGRGDTIHFPYSRHSSYMELRHLVSVFRPKDICPCTVEPEVWSEEVSMQVLFGDVCSGNEFHFDKESRATVEDWKERQRLNALRGQKRIFRDDDEVEQETQETQDTHATQETHGSLEGDEVFETARAEVKEVGLEAAELGASVKPSVSPVEDTQPAIRSNLGPGRLKEIREAFLCINGGKNTIDHEDEQASIAQRDSRADHSRKIFDGYDLYPEMGSDGEDFDDGWDDEDRIWARMEAYNAARRCLVVNDAKNWDDLSLRSAGRKGHEEEEVEL